MKRLVLATAAVAAFAAATPANAAISLGATSGANTVVSITDNAGNPNRLQFDTSNVGPGSTTAWFDFSESYAFTGVFTLGAATDPASTVTLIELLTGNPLTVFASAGPSPNSITYVTGLLAANTTYRFQYTVNLGTAGNISGNAALYRAAVPEPATWAMMLLGFGGIGMAMRRRRRPVLAQVA